MALWSSLEVVAKAKESGMEASAPPERAVRMVDSMSLMVVVACFDVCLVPSLFYLAIIDN